MKNESLLERAHWIWPGAVHEDRRNVHADFRYDFRVKRKSGAARLAITADQGYMLYFNGEYVGRGPARGYQWSWPYDEYDLSARVRPGHNWISVRVYNAGCGTFQYIHQAAYGMICAGEICGERILSGEGWMGRVSAANRRDTVKLSVQLNYQEWMDTRVDDQEWIRSGRRPSGWETPPVRRPCGYMPWHSLEPRGVPNLSNEVLAYRRVVVQGAGRCDAQYRTDSNLTLPWFRELKHLAWNKTDEALPKKSCSHNVIPDLIGNPESENWRWIPASAGMTKCGLEWLIIPATGRGKLKAVVFDLGRPAIGTLIVGVKGAGGGEVVDFFFFEVLSADGRPALEDPKKGCAMAMSARLIMRKGKTQHEFYQMMGHRYMAVIARDTRRSLQIQLRLRETVYPMEIKGGFKSGDGELNNIH